MSEEPIRVLLAKVGLDGHDRGVKVVARALRDAGMEVVYTGLHRSPEEVVSAATQEDVDVIGVSLLSGAHMALFPRIIDLMKEQEIFGDHLLLGGGVIPDEDVEELKSMGVDEILGQDTPPDVIVDSSGPWSPSAVSVSGGVLELPAALRRRLHATAGPANWFPERETMDPDERDAPHPRAPARGLRLRARALAVLPREVGRLRPAHRPGHPRGLRAPARHPQGRAARRPGRASAVRLLHCIEPDDVVRVHGTSGTTGRPTAFGIGRDDWRAIANAHARIMWGMGIRPADTRLHRVGLQPLHGLVGDALRAPSASARPRSRSAPASPGRASARSTGWRRCGPAPSTARRPTRCDSPRSPPRRASTRGLRHPDPVLLRRAGRVDPEHPRPDRGDLRRQGLRLRLDGGDDAVDETRSPRRRPGCSAGRTSSTRRFAIPETDRRLPYGREGTPVYTHLERTSQPMIRLESGDLARWESGPSPCGRTYPCLPRGIYGRIDDMFRPRRERVPGGDRGGPLRHAAATAASSGSSSAARRRWTSSPSASSTARGSQDVDAFRARAAGGAAHHARRLDRGRGGAARTPSSGPSSRRAA